MAELITADSADALCTILADASACGRRLQLCGGGSLAGIAGGAAGDRLSLAALRGEIDHDAGELVVSAGAATPLAEIEAVLAGHDQMLACEPLDHRGLYNGEGPGPTLGGVIAANAAGPRRLLAGNVRDHFIGFTAVSGGGELFQSGGRVVKNVSGFDLSRLLAGSWGTLAALTRVTLRTLPRPRHTASWSLHGLSAADATAAMTAALRAPLEISGCAHLHPAAAARIGLPGGDPVTLFRLEGIEPSVAARGTMLAELLAAHGPLHPLDDGSAPWTALRACRQLAPAPAGLWRLALPATRAATLIERGCGADDEWALDWGGGLVWLAVGAADRGPELLALADALGASARCYRPHAADAHRPAAAQPPALRALRQRLKQAFDPAGVLVDPRDPGGG